MKSVPDHLIYPADVFAESFAAKRDAGENELRLSDVAFIGLARNCERALKTNLHRLLELCKSVGSWKLHVETNDNVDGTDQVLADFCGANRQATFTSQRLDRPHCGAEFAGRRTQALAEYRAACQNWVRENAAQSRFVIAIDFDMWGGWSHIGVLHGVGSLAQNESAYGMASVSLLEYRQRMLDTSNNVVEQGAWVHYDCWALRLNSTFDDYSSGMGGWKHSWLPPVGSPPIPVCSAFGAMVIYDTQAFLQGAYEGSDCEHVTFHKSIADKTGKSLYLDPAMRTVMQWLE